MKKSVGGEYVESDVPHWLHILGMDTVHSICSSERSVVSIAQVYPGTVASGGVTGFWYGRNIQLDAGKHSVSRTALHLDPDPKDAQPSTGYRVEGCDV